MNVKNIKELILWVSFMLTFALSFANNPDELITREQMWIDKTLEVESYTDGVLIDPKMIELVVGLNLNGMKIQSFSEGNLDQLYYPYVVFHFDEIDTDKLMIDLETAHANRFSSDAAWKLYIEELHKIIFHTELQALGIKNLLDEFYENRVIDYDAMIVLECFSNSIDIHNCGGDFQLIRSPEERANRLEAYQNEMIAFGQFVKEKYLKE